jgi:L-ascorbate metabolism protein UlaG (beta-lactamase superfamily)
VLSKAVPLFCQPEDEQKFRDLGFSGTHVVSQSLHWRGIEIRRTGGQHGKGDIGKAMAPVSGFVLLAAGNATLYIAGDTIWCDEAQQALRDHRPKIVVVNTGAARFLEGDPITMTADDVIMTCQAAPNAQIVAVHMEAINHCLLTRADLAFQLEAARVIQQVAIPGDGDWVDVSR